MTSADLLGVWPGLTWDNVQGMEVRDFVALRDEANRRAEDRQGDGSPSDERARRRRARDSKPRLT